MSVTIPQTPAVPRGTTGKFKVKSYDGDLMEIGVKAEMIVKDWLIAHPEVLGVDDLSHLQELQRIDTDFTIRMRDGSHPLAEVKSDANLGRTGNVLVEFARLNHLGPPEAAITLGWTMRTEARWILYFASSLGYVFQFRTQELRRCIQRYTGRQRVNSNVQWINTDNVKSTLILLVPLRECRGAYQVHDVLEYARPHLPHLSDELRLRFPVDSLQF